MGLSREVREHTRREWRDLGFFYELDHARKIWRLVGSKAGLRRFADLLHAYAGDSRNATPSEHEHYGPYLYLEIMTWATRGADDHSIHGTLDDLRQLASIVEHALCEAPPGSICRAGDLYAPSAPYGIQLEVREDGFDPASADPLLDDASG
jgi:hypothetical protein